MTSEEQAVTEAVKTLYDVFAVHPPAQKVEGCPCCVSAEEGLGALYSKIAAKTDGQDTMQ